MSNSPIIHTCLLVVVGAAVVFTRTECRQLTSYTHGNECVIWEHTGHSTVQKMDATKCTIKRVAPSEKISPPSLVKRSLAEFEEDKKLCERHERQRRFIMLGTKWCGDGNSAKDEDDLGLYAKEDMCCRTHDHCDRNIHGGQVKYGVKNTSPYTWSDCQCDHEFRQCLQKLNSTISNTIGDMFFNILKGIKCVKFDSDGTAVAHGKESYEKRGVWDLLKDVFG